MFKNEIDKLDNPVWYSLAESHKKFTFNYNKTVFYNPEYCAFGATLDNENCSNAIEKYVETANSFFIVGKEPLIPSHLKIENELVCLQMILQQPISIPITDTIVKLEANNRDDLLALVKIVYPDYFKAKTPDLSNYYGIYKENQLVAVTGERMHMNNYIEVSAVITHPDYLGKGYAKQLVAHTANAIFEQNKIPYLHVYEKNFGAIKLYEKLGFVTRRKISFWNISKT